MEKRRNPIAEQSRQWIMAALAEMLKTKTFEEITVSGLSEKAGLSRRTFYRNFNSKTEVVIACCEQLCSEYIAFLDEDIEYSVRHIIGVYFSFWEQHLDFLRLLSDNELLCHLIDVSNKYWPEIYDRFKKYWKTDGSEEELEYCLLYNMGGLWNILIKWMYSGTRKSPGHMEELLRNSLMLFMSGM